MNMKDIKELRERTGAGVLDCKNALSEADGDLEKAVEILREKGMADAAKKAGRVAAEGMVNVLTQEEQKKGVIVEINCETDFVAKNEKFQNLVDNISEHILKSDSNNTEDVLSEPWYKDNSKNVDTVIKEAIASIGENINLRRFKKYTTKGFLQEYIHLGGKIGVLVDINGELTEDKVKAAKNVAMHIAASNPQFLSREDVDKNVLEKEKKIYREQMVNEGKPEHIIDQIVKGKINKFYEQVCLLEQAYIRNQDQSVGEYLQDNNINVNNYTRFELGEGIEVEKEDFANEVMSEIENK